MATLEGYKRRKPKKPQLFEYQFNGARFGGELVYFRDILHAIGNSDQYPANLWEDTQKSKVCTATIDAVAEAIEACPRYRAQPCSLTPADLATDRTEGKIRKYTEIRKGRNNDICARCGKRYNTADKALFELFHDGAEPPEYDLLCLAETIPAGYRTHGNIKLCGECMTELLTWLGAPPQQKGDKEECTEKS